MRASLLSRLSRTGEGKAAMMPEKSMRPRRPFAALSALPSWTRRPLAPLSALASDCDRLIAALVLAGLAYYYLVPAPLLALPGLLLFALCAWRRLPLVLCLLPLTFPYWFVPKRVAGHVVFPLSEIALAVCAAVALAQTLERVRRSGLQPMRLQRCTRALGARLGNWICLGAGLLLLGTLVGVALARQHPEAWRTERWDVLEPLLYLLLITVYVRGRQQAR